MIRCLVRSLFVAALLAPLWGGAQNYPIRPVRVIVPFPPSGATDIMARNAAQVLTEAWGQPVLVDNRPGGNALIGADLAAKAPADGYTLLAVTLTHAINASLFPKASFDLRRDVTVVSVLASLPMVVVVHPALPVKNLSELTALAKSRRLNAGSSGNGSPPHLGLEQYKQIGGFDAQHIPYKGGAPSITDLVGGQTDFIVSNLPESIGQLKGGRLRPLAITARSRHPLVPDVPTTTEAGLPGLSISNWIGLVAPAGTPKEIVARIQAEVARGLRQPEMTRKAQEQAFEIVASTPEAAQAYVHEEIDRWARVVKAGNVRAE